MTKNLPGRTWLLLLAILVLFVIFSCTEKDPLVVTGNIEGTISDIETNSVIQGVIVTLTAIGNSTPINQSKATGSDGKFSFIDLEAGSYKLSFKKDGYEDNSKNITLIAGQTSSSDVGMKPVKPKLTVSKSELNFGTAETALTFQISNTGKGELKWEVKGSIDWLSLSPSSGSSITEPSSVSVSIDRKKAEPGNYERIISVTSNGGSADILIKVIIEGPKLDVNPLNLDFGIVTDKKILLLKNIGIGILDYTISTDETWISIIPNSGNLTTETDQIDITVNRNGLNYGNYTGKINIISKLNTVFIDVQMVIPDPNKPLLTISPKEINFGNKDISANLVIKNSGNGILEWSLTDNQAWLDVSKNSGSITAGESAELVVSIVRGTLAPNNYSGLITITSNGGVETCKIQMEIPSEPVLSYEPAILNFRHDKTTLPFFIKNIGTGYLNWSLLVNKEWITLSGTSGVNQSTVNVSVDRSKLTNGLYSGQVSINSNGGSGFVVINVEKRNPNTPPVVDFSVNPSSGFLETNFAVTINASDDYTPVGNLLIRCKWQDNDPFTDWSGTMNYSHIYTTSGTKNITVEVKDEDGASKTLTKSVEVRKNEKPIASFTVVPISGTINTEFNVDASGSSDDFTSKQNLQVRWQWDDNMGFTNWTQTKIASYKYATAGLKTIIVEVKDEAGLVGSTTQKVTIDDSEKEPNNNCQEAQVISLNSKIVGTLTDYDYYTFVPTVNGNMSFSLKNLSPNPFYSYCYLIEDGYDNSYYISNYLSTIRDVSAMTKVISETVPVSRGVKYFFKIITSYNSPGMPYELSTVFVPISESDNGEPNNSAPQASNITLNSTITALIGYAQDEEDYYLFTPAKDGVFSFTTKNLHPSGISLGTIGTCSLLRYGEVNSLTSISYIQVATTKNSSTITLSKDIKYIIKVKKYDVFNSAPYELKTTFQ